MKGPGLSWLKAVPFEQVPVLMAESNWRLSLISHAKWHGSELQSIASVQVQFNTLIPSSIVANSNYISTVARLNIYCFQYKGMKWGNRRMGRFSPAPTGTQPIQNETTDYHLTTVLIHCRNHFLQFNNIIHFFLIIKIDGPASRLQYCIK